MSAANPALVPLDDLRRILGEQPGGILDAVAKPDAEGRVDLVVVLPAFFNELRASLRAGSATASAERARLARAAAQELRLAEAQRTLIPSDDAETAMDHLVGTVLTSIASMPARLTRDVRQRRVIEARLHALQGKIAHEITSL